MYGKLFASLYQGTLRGCAHPILVFTNLIAHADSHGHVDKHPRAIAEEVGLTIEQVNKALEELEAPDPESRSPEEEGRRIIRLDEHRAWGWRIVNHEKYRSIRSEEDRREQNRLAQQRWRERKAQSKQDKPSVSSGETDKPKQKQKQEEEKDMSPKRAPRASGDAHFDRFWAVYPKKENKPGAIKAWKRVRPDPDAVVAGVEAWRKSERWAKGFIVAPAKFLSERRWEDAPQVAYHGSTEVAL